MKRMLTYALLALISCGQGQDLGSRIDYYIEEPLIDAGPGGCFPGPTAYLAEAETHVWAPGAQINVEAFWPDRNDCRLITCHSEECQPVTVEIRETNAAAWRVAQHSSAHFTLLAVADGEGGVRVKGNGRDFDPALTVTVSSSASEIWAERLLAWNQGWSTQRLTELRMSPGEVISVALTMRDIAGKHICGQLEMTLTVEPATLVSLQSHSESPHVNDTYRVTAMSSPGRGVIHASVGTLRLDLPLTIE
jgi:hypothetical protein